MQAVRDLAAILTAIEIRSEKCYELRGTPREASVEVPAESGALPPVVAALQALLYSSFYCRSTAEPEARDLVASRDLTRRLSEANCGKGTWEPGWQVAGREENGRIAVHKEGLTVYALESQFRERDGAIVPGATGRLKVGKELRGMSPGFYLAIGDGDEDDRADDELPLVRAYFHLMSEGAVPFIAEGTRLFNEAQVPFRAKTLTEPKAYVRADSAVLYLRQRHYRRVEHQLAELHERLRPYLRRPVPRFTRALAPGLGIAEDPLNGESFGQNRCRLVALGLWRAFSAGRTGRNQRAAAVAATFLEAGLDPKRPHLDRGSTEDYSWWRQGHERLPAPANRVPPRGHPHRRRALS